jgi:carboxyl-terminal processing protease
VDAEINLFARILVHAAAEVSNQYVRPVENVDLIYAALAGLYQTARLAEPRGLREDIRKAVLPPAGPPRELEVPPGALDSPTSTQVSAALVHLIHKAYLDTAEALRGQNPLIVALRAMTASLDPFTTVVTAEEPDLLAGQNEAYLGLGIEVEANSPLNQICVRNVHPGSPAQKAGLMPGDEIVGVGDKPIASVPDLDRAALRNTFHLEPIVGPEGPVPELPVKLTLRRRGVPGERTVRLAPERYRPETVLGVSRNEDNTWHYWLDRRRGVAQIRVGPLAPGTAAQLGEVLLRLRDEGLHGLLLDLRWCPGGLIREATGAAELFLGQVEIARTKERAQERVFRSTGEPKFQDLPVMVLINGATSGGGELIAAALQDHGRGRVWVTGQRSRGKGSIQTPLPLPRGIGLKVTSGTFFRSTGKNLHRFADSKPQDDWGVRPDPGLEFRISAGLERQLRDCWLLQTLRPGSSNEALPLDDPEADPQRLAALERLLEQLDRKVRAKSD